MVRNRCEVTSYVHGHPVTRQLRSCSDNLCTTPLKTRSFRSEVRCGGGIWLVVPCQRPAGDCRGNSGCAEGSDKGRRPTFSFSFRFILALGIVAGNEPRLKFPEKAKGGGVVQNEQFLQGDANRSAHKQKLAEETLSRGGGST